MNIRKKTQRRRALGVMGPEEVMEEKMEFVEPDSWTII